MKRAILMRNLLIFFSGVMVLAGLSACGGSGGGNDSSVVTMGNLSTSLTDSSTEDYRAIYVTIDRVDVQKDGDSGWKVVANPDATYNLLDLVNGVREELDIVPLESGHYNQLRLIIGSQADTGNNILMTPHPLANYLIDQADQVHELKIPSGMQTGIKIVHGFDISENQTTELILDFNAMKSVVKAGNSGKHLLKPTIKVLQMVDSAIVTGLVSDAGSGPPEVGIEGALVSAQVDNGLTADAKDRVEVERSTIAAGDDDQTAEDETGAYTLFLPAGTYNLVAYSTGYEPICRAISLTAGTTTEDEDFSLVAADTGTIQGEVTISEASPDQHVTLDFRRSGDCADINQVISVKSIQVENGGTYAVELPADTYQVVSSTPGKTTQSVDVIVTHDAISQLNPGF